MTTMDDLPPPNSAKPPAFDTLDDERFEEFCWALLDAEPGVTTADRFMAPRQKQYGADVIGRYKDGSLVIVSCKCYKKAEKGHIPTACDEFLMHWDSYWNGKQVRKFILAITADVRSRQRQEEIKAQRVLFESKAIEFEMWAPRQLLAKMRPHRGIVTQYLDEAHADRYCGRLQPRIGESSPDRMLVQELARIQSTLAEDVDSHLDRILTDLKCGRITKVDQALSDLKNDPTRWSVLTEASRARIVRLQASRHLQTDLIERAREFADQADEIDRGAGGRRLRAAFAAQSGDLDGALRTLGDHETADDASIEASIWLAKGDPSRAVSALEGFDSAEECALRAHAFAALGQLENARRALDTAEYGAPDFLNVRRAGISVRYASALSPAMKYSAEAWLDPVPLGLVCEHREALGFLTKAHQIAVQALRDPDLSNECREEFETWKLACLANLRGRSGDAESYATELLKSSKPHRGAIIWSLARGYAVNHRREINRLEKLLRGGYGEASHLAVLCAVAIDQGKPRRAMRALADYGDRFPSAKALLDRWHAIATAALGEENKNEQPVGFRLSEAVTQGAWDDVAEQVQSALGDSDVVLAYQGLECLAHHDQWPHLKGFIPSMLETIRTSEAITMACVTAYNTGDPERARQITDDYRLHFPGDQLPLAMRRVRLRVLQQTGDLPAAYQEAEGLAETGELPDVISAIDTKIQAGDVRGALPFIRRAASHNDLTPDLALNYARVVKSADPGVAEQLWDRAQENDLSGELAELAAAVAFELGFDDRAGPVIKQAMDRAGQPGSSIQRVSIDEVKEFVQARRKKQEQVRSRHQNGEIPIHLACDELGLSLADWFNRAFSDGSTPFLIQHGNRGRKASLDIPRDQTRLRMDITALLMAYHLGLIDQLERTWAPIEIAHSLPRALLEMERQLRPHQPSEESAKQQLVQSIDDGTVIEIAMSEQGHPEGNGGTLSSAIVVDYEVTQTPGPSANPRRVLDALVDLGAASGEIFERARKALGTLAQEEPEGDELTLQQQVIFAKNTITSFIRAGLLRPLCSTFSIYVDRDYAQSVRNELTESSRRIAVADEITRIRERISNGIQTDTYRVLEYSSDLGRQEDECAQGEIGLTTRCLLEVITAPADSTTLVWIDDRMMTRYSAAEDLRIAGVCDILGIIKRENLLNEEDRQSCLLYLREAHAQFLPLTAEEILYHLETAPLNDGTIKETRGLKALRKSVAETGQLEAILQLDPDEPRHGDRQDEIGIAQMLWREPREALVLLWSEEIRDKPAVWARANWIYDNLVVDHFERIPARSDCSSRRRLFVTGHAGFIVDGLHLLSGRDSRSNRGAYFDWLNSNVIVPVVTADPSMAGEIAEVVGDILIGLCKESEKDRSETDDNIRQHATLLIAEYIQEIPESIRNCLASRDELTKQLPIRIQASVDLGDARVASETFFGSVAVAMEEGRSTMSTSSGTTITLNCEVNAPHRVRLQVAEKSERVLEDPAFAVLCGTPESRYQILAAHPEWVDRVDSDRAEVNREIARISDPSVRMLRVDEERQISAAFQYWVLEQRLDTQEGIGVEVLNDLTYGMVFRHLRLGCLENSSKENGIEESAQELIENLGAPEAIRRLAGLPISLPDCLTDALREMDGPARDSLIQELGQKYASPMRQMRAVAWTRVLELDSLSTRVENLICELKSRVGLLYQVLRWTERSFEKEEGWRKLSQRDRLLTVWGHGERVTDLFLRSGADHARAAPVIEQWTPRMVGSWLLRDGSDDSDPCSPNATSTELLLVGIIEVAIGDDHDESMLSEHREYLAGSVGQVMEDGCRWPATGAMSRPCRPSCVEFVFREYGSKVGRLIGDSELEERLDPAFAEMLAGEALSELENDAQNDSAWMKLLLARGQGVKEEEVGRLVSILETLDVSSLNSKYKDTTLAAVTCLSRSFELMSVEAGRSRVETILVELSKSISERDEGAHSGNANQTDALAMISDCVLHASRHVQESDRTQQLMNLLRGVLDNAPDAAPLWRKALPDIARQLPFELAAPVWPLILELRAR